MFAAAKLFNLPTPTPFVLRQNLSQALQGINFAMGDAGATYGYGIIPLDEQVGNMEALVRDGVLTKPHLRNSVGVISVGLNDYDSRNLGTPFQESAFTKELNTFVASLVDTIALSIVRLNAIGIRHFVVANLPYMSAFPSPSWNSPTQAAAPTPPFSIKLHSTILCCMNG